MVNGGSKGRPLNPFGDEDDEAGTTNPFGRPPLSNPFDTTAPARRHKAGSRNPFEGESELSGRSSSAAPSDEYVNPFDRKKPAPMFARCTSAPNPFDDDTTPAPSNPFADDASPPPQALRGRRPHSIPPPQAPPRTQSPVVKATEPVRRSSTPTSDSFEFEPEFSSSTSKPKRAFLPFASKKRSDDLDSEPILAGMDADEKHKPPRRLTPDTTAGDRSTSQTHTPQLATPAISMNIDARIMGGANNLASWLRGNKDKDDEELAAGTNGGADTNDGNAAKPKVALPGFSRKNAVEAKKKNNRQSGGSKGGSSSSGAMNNIQRWPYDDYHKEQEKQYLALLERENGGAKTKKGGASANSKKYSKNNKKREKSKLGRLSDSDEDDVDNSNTYDKEDTVGYHSGSDDEKKENTVIGSKFATEDDSKYYQRPEDLLSINDAVQNLNLADFEPKAEERAITIISAWLFDAGLIDELLVNGAISGSIGRSSNGSVGDGSRSSSSVKTSEGVEVGAHGFPILGNIEGGLKMDKEIEKLRTSTQRELGLINSRLNDGVATSGAEVQELVNAVAMTKSDLGRLRELSTYISNGYVHSKGKSGDPMAEEKEVRDDFLLTPFPKLKSAINARRNLFRCFRELEFFSQIPSTCGRLREELHSGEWTADEWSTIRSVSMEHVELEILLIEAEAGMKARIDYEGSGEDDELSPFKSNRNLNSKFKTKNTRQPGTSTSGNYEMVDKFLSQHVKNVWELGDEIRMRILSGIGSSFDLALNNPAGMVALVEAVEVYERAAEQYKKMYEGEGRLTGKNCLNFTDMRAAALAQLYQDFELRGLEVFRAIHMQAADMAEEEDALNSQFTAVLRAATELVAEIDRVKNQMTPCFAPHWHVEVLWSSCVAHVCSNQIIQQIGGPDGHNLPDLTVTQLLDLVAWVEFFRETIEESFPNVASMHAKKTYFDSRPDLFDGNKKEVNMATATDSLAWVNNMLWEVHRLAQEEFLHRTRDQTEEWLVSVYDAEHEKNQTSEGRLTTSLCEDVFSLAGVQLRTIRERLSKKSDALVMAVCLVFSLLRSKQIHSRDVFLLDLETCCAAANDFQRMSEKCEDVMQELLQESEFTDESVNMLEASSGELLALYSGDAVYAAQKSHVHVFEPIGEAIAAGLFGFEWESSMTHNELALTLTRTLEDFMGDLEQFLDEYMLKKTVDALVTSSIVFYVKCLLLKAENHNSNKASCFANNETALDRMAGDIKIIRGYFEGLIETMPALGKVIEREFEVLTTIQELMSIAAELSESDAGDFILVLHKRIQDINITKQMVGDLWHLVQPAQERAVWELVESMENTLLAICPPDESAARKAQDRMQVPGLRLDEMMVLLYTKSTRKRPVKAGTIEKMVNNWNMTWAPEDKKESTGKKATRPGAGFGRRQTKEALASDQQSF